MEKANTIITREMTIRELITIIPIGKEIVIKPYDIESILEAIEPLEKLKSKTVQNALGEFKWKFNNFYDHSKAY